MNKICITGANGFIGSALCQTLIKSNVPIVALVTKLESLLKSDKIKYIKINDLSSEKNLKEYFTGCDYIIHCAGKSYNQNYKLDDFKLANIESTRNIAKQAVMAGVKRIIFLSSVKVHGENSNKKNNSKPFSINDVPEPQDDYALSKLIAERSLWEIATKTNLEVVIMRLPLVYGNGARGNLNRLIKLISFGIPLPFGCINNKRSLLGIDNAVDVIIKSTKHPNAAGKTFLVSDNKDLSTPELINEIASAMNRSAKVFPFPISFLKFIGLIFKKKSEIQRLTESLQLDNTYVKEILNWLPPISTEEGIKKMIQEK